MLFSAQLHWFMLFALSPSFYPSEAEAKGWNLFEI